MRELNNIEIDSIAGSIHLSHKLIGAVLGTICATITGGPVGAGYFLTSAIAAESALRLTDMFNAHDFQYRPNEAYGIIWHTEFMW